MMYDIRGTRGCKGRVIDFYKGQYPSRVCDIPGDANGEPGRPRPGPEQFMPFAIKKKKNRPLA